jgi:hypothetical protein
MTNIAIEKVGSTMRRWNLTCLLCDSKITELSDRFVTRYTDLITIQEHAMNDHGYTQQDHRNAKSREITPNHYIYTFPDGKDWMDAERESSTAT